MNIKIIISYMYMHVYTEQCIAYFPLKIRHIILDPLPTF